MKEERSVHVPPAKQCRCGLAVDQDVSEAEIMRLHNNKQLGTLVYTLRVGDRHVKQYVEI